VVTGAASGLGAEYARRLAQLGFDLAICDLVESEETVAAVEAEGRRAYAAIADASVPAEVEVFADGVRDELGPVAVLVNNVGVSPFSPFEQITLEEWQRTMRVNLDSLFLVTRAFLEDMKIAQWGRIVNVTTAVGWDAERLEVVHYETSKMGVLGFTRSLAGEVGPYGITVNSICPGLIKTPLLDERIPQQSWQRNLGRQAIKRYGEPADLLAALTMLVSDEAGFITGINVPVHGGRVVI
jgi:NAD(P)-dependent dehydrogenase (short-subunit alcohol dehydrogenase family)